MFLIRSWVTADIQSNLSTVLCEFHSIAKKIHQDFSNTRNIRKDIWVLWSFSMYFKLKISVIKKSIHNRLDIICQLSNVHWLGRNSNFSTFNATKIQYVIQQREKMIRTFLNFLQAIMNI